MTLALPIATAPADGRPSSTRDQASGRSGQNGGASSFEGVLADVGDNTAAAATKTSSATSGIASSLSSFLQLLNGGTTPDGESKSDKSGSKTDKDDTTPDSKQVADPLALGAGAAIAALQAASTTTQATAAGAILAPAKTTSPTAAIGTALGTAANLDDMDLVAGANISAGLSVVKVETHLAVDALPGKSLDGKGTGSAATPAVASPGPGASAKTTGAAAADLADTTPSSVSTSDAPGLPAATPAPPIQTIANAAAKLAAAAPANIPSDTASTPAAPPRTMTIQLTPASLGTVNVTMHLTGQSLDLQLAVSDKDTLGALSRDRDSLTQAVQDQGYDLRTLVIQGTDAQSAASSNGNSSGRDQTNQQAQSRSDGQGSQSGTGSNGSDRRHSQSQGNATNEVSRTPGSKTGAGGLFV